MSYPVSIIVPIYGVEKYIAQCATSLFAQDFADIEYVFVNDCTPDNSIAVLEEVIEKYPDRKPHIKIIHHQQNKGLGAARKTGIFNATGEYVLHIDSDDWCELDMISSLYQKAKEDDADILVCDFYISTSKCDKYVRQDYTTDRKKNLQGLLNGSLHGAVWNKLIKKSLYIDNNIFPPSEISLLEDKWLTLRLIYLCKKINYLPKAFLHYRQDNSVSLTKELNEKKIGDLKWYADTTEAFLKENGVYERYKDFFLMGNLLCVLTFSRGRNYKKIIMHISPESNNIFLLWRITCMSTAVKIVNSFAVLGFPFVVVIFRKIHSVLFRLW